MEQEYVGRSGDVGGYRVEVDEHRVRVLKEGVPVVDRAVPPLGDRSIGQMVADARRLRINWQRSPLGDEVIELSDRPDDAGAGWAYTIDISDPDASGWFPTLGIDPA